MFCSLNSLSLTWFESARIVISTQALWLKPDDQFCTEMLSMALLDECRYGANPNIEFQRNEIYL